MLSVLSTQRIRVQKISRWALAPVVDARTVAIAIRLILKLDLDEALSSFQKCKQITEPETCKPGSTPHPQPPLGLRMSFPFVRHSRAGGNPASLALHWIPAYAGTTCALDSRLRGNDLCTGFPPTRERLSVAHSGGLPWRHLTMLVDQFEGWPR